MLTNTQRTSLFIAEQGNQGDFFFNALRLKSLNKILINNHVTPLIQYTK